MVNIETIKDMYGSKSSSRRILDYFARRLKNSRTTTVDRLQAALSKEKIGLARTEIIDFFRELEAAECGRFVVGRKGHTSRFEWSVSPIDVGRTARGEDVELHPISDEEFGKSIVTEEEANEVIDHRFVLRPGFDVHLELPEDLTTSEANRLADFVRTLPFS